MQTSYDMDARDFADAKRELRSRLAHLTEQLDRYLATEYGISESIILNKKEYESAFNKWRTSHQPFHWFAEFYGIMNRGGFDAIIGNPPYVVYSPGKVEYSVEPMGYFTIASKNLYSYVFERSSHLASRSCPVGLIVQLTALSSEKMQSLQDLLSGRGSLLALPFPRRPQSMFDGVEMPVTILLSLPGPRGHFTTARVGRIYGEEREMALHQCALMNHNVRTDGYRIAKIGAELELNIMRKIVNQPKAVGYLCATVSDLTVYYQEACRYWLKASAGLPYFNRNGRKAAPPHGRILHFRSSDDVSFVECLLNSSLFFWCYSALSDCEHVNDQLVRAMKIPGQQATEPWGDLSYRLGRSLQKNSVRKKIRTKQGHVIEYDEMSANISKDIIDEIDVALAKHYGLTDEELDFIINYDIKYRMGQDSGDDERE
jgi:hypothetical protein